jgi:hypothetical protein
MEKYPEGGVPMVCVHDWKTFEGYDGPDGINCIRECVRCGLTERCTHLYPDDGTEIHNETMLSTPQ